MDAEATAALVSAAVAALGLILAVQQALAARRARRTAAVEIAELTAALTAALTQVRSAADSADSIVQRSKARASGAEIQNLARVTRAQLAALSADIQHRIDSGVSAAAWHPGQAVASPQPNQTPLPPVPPPLANGSGQTGP